MKVSHPAEKAGAFGLSDHILDGRDPFAIYDEVHYAAELARSGGGPSLIEIDLCRPTPHSSDDDDHLYRTEKDVLACKQRDPLRHTRIILEKEGLLNDKRLKLFEEEAESLIEEALQEALNAPDPDPARAIKHVYA